MIRHTVVFSLKHAAGSAEEQAFLEAALILKAIPGVEKFERLRQTSPKADFDFGFSMEFADQPPMTATTTIPITRLSLTVAGSRKWRVSRKSTTCRCEPDRPGRAPRRRLTGMVSTRN